MVTGMGVATDSQRAIVHVRAGGFDDLVYEFARSGPNKVWLFQVRCGGSVVPHRDGASSARKAALDAMNAKRTILDAKYPRAAALPRVGAG